MENEVSIFWFRRDLRIDDNVGLNAALQDGLTQGVFIFDKDILDKLEDKEDKRVGLIYDQLNQIHDKLHWYRAHLHRTNELYHNVRLFPPYRYKSGRLLAPCCCHQ